MRDQTQLEATLKEIDGRGYKAYKALEGPWGFDGFALHVDHVQGDPFASPTRVRAVVESDVTKLPPGSLRTPCRQVGVAAFLARVFSDRARSLFRRRGTGRSGEIRMEHPGQIVVPQTAVLVSESGQVEARFAVGLPGKGRSIAGREARSLLLDDVPTLVNDALLATARDVDQIERHAAANEDATALRETLAERSLVAFVADGARLPRRSGVDDRPFVDGEIVPFVSPATLRHEIDLPNAGSVTGMGIPEGITLIVGGGFHGKSTLLRAVQDGVYNHQTGDGRELVVSRADCVKVRAEDGRSVVEVDISPFIEGLPLDRDTHDFSTANASGSTSQAAAIVEALEAGAGALLVDEDTSATNFMIRDRRMQELVPKSGEPITPFVDRVQELHTGRGVSTVLVLGGSGDYLDIADTVIRMQDYTPRDVTVEAKRVARGLPTGRQTEASTPVATPNPRIIDRTSIDPTKGRISRSVKVPDDRTLLFGTSTIDLVAVEQLAGRSQTRAIGHALAWLAEARLAGSSDMRQLLDTVDRLIENRQLDALCRERFGDLAFFRRFELAAALNRLRTLRVAQHSTRATDGDTRTGSG